MNNSLNEQEFVTEEGSARTSGYAHGADGHIRAYIVDNQDGAYARFTAKKKDPAANDYVEERLRNVESQLNILSPAHYPSDVYARLKVIEDKLMKMEELYPQISAHLLNYEEKFDDRLGGRVTRAPGFYTELRVSKKKRSDRPKTAPLGIELEAAQASTILKNKMAELKNKLLKWVTTTAIGKADL